MRRNTALPVPNCDYEEMLKQEKPDAAYIATTVNFHHDLLLLCIRYGIPVLCEKAMVMNSAEAKEVFAAAKSANVYVMEAMWSRFLCQYRGLIAKLNGTCRNAEYLAVIQSHSYSGNLVFNRVIRPIEMFGYLNVRGESRYVLK